MVLGLEVGSVSTKDMQSIFEEIGRRPVGPPSDAEDRRKRIVKSAEHY
ncbi:MAG: hypothetical protein KF901_11270 [Myxococcales bacterium]|nr:hypothetical protein [Myxococcales bacterium]